MPNPRLCVDDAPEVLWRSLRESLLSLTYQPHLQIKPPEGCDRRASVALILRIRPDFHHWPEDETAEAKLDQFFAKPWVQHGDPEVAFIKRASREGDRWTSHVALPGGKRDPEDADDKAVAIRETAEEIGLDLTSDAACFVGNLPERVVSISAGRVPIMVLCSFVFLWTKPDLPPLKLQPGEVASIHWVPLRALLSPFSRTYEYVDASDRFAKRVGPLVKLIVRSVIGSMRFSAIRLVPSESLYCSCTDEFFPRENLTEPAPWTSRLYQWCWGDYEGPSGKTPLLLWGLTLGILTDFLEKLPPHNALQLWSYPNFTSLDVRLIINLLTVSLKRRNMNALQRCVIQKQRAAVATGDCLLLTGTSSGFVKHRLRGANANQAHGVGILLEGYYDVARRGVFIAASLRLLGFVALAFAFIKRYRLRRSR